jgi:hypothetical protein
MRSGPLLVVVGLAATVGVIVSHVTEPTAPNPPRDDPEPAESARGIFATPASQLDRADEAPIAVAVEPTQSDRHWPAPLRVVCRFHKDDREAYGECAGSLLEMRFDSEQVDPDWAGATERIFVDGLTGVSEVAAVTSMTVQCKETVCRLQMGFRSMGDVPTRGPPERDQALVDKIFVPLLQRAGLPRLIAPYPLKDDVPQRTYYFTRNL